MTQSHGTGLGPWEFAHLGEGVVFEQGVLVIHPETITIADNVYVGHQTILKGYHKNTMTIGNGTWIGQQCFLHSAGGIEIGCGRIPGARWTDTHSHMKQKIYLEDIPLEEAQNNKYERVTLVTHTNRI